MSGVLLPASRPSTLASALDDARGLFPYIAATTLKTVRDNPDLMTRLSLTNGDWREFKEVYEEADRRGGKREASDGTNVHMVVQALAMGLDISAVPEPAKSDGIAVMTFLEEQGWEIIASEQFVVTEGLPELCAGTLDLLLRDRDGNVFIGDIKTVGKVSSVKYKAVSWSVQESVYARGNPYPHDYKRDQWGRPMVDPGRVQRRPKASRPRTDAGVVLEVVRGEGRVKAHWLDLDGGWRLALHACQVRASRKVGQALILKDGPTW